MGYYQWYQGVCSCNIWPCGAPNVGGSSIDRLGRVGQQTTGRRRAGLVKMVRERTALVLVLAVSVDKDILAKRVLRQVDVDIHRLTGWGLNNKIRALKTP